MEYKSKRVRDIITRQTGFQYDLEQYKEEINFGTEVFTFYKYPELVEKIKILHSLTAHYHNKDDIQIEDNFYTSNIEGARISTINEIREICNAKFVHGKKEGMVLGYSEAINVLKNSKNQVIDVNFANEVQQAVIKYYSENAHKSLYRDNSICVGNDIEVVFKPCDSNLIAILYPQVFETHDSDPFIQAALLHFFLVYLHPYFDGNGRTARLLMQEYIVRNVFQNKEYFPMSKYIHENISGYYKSLKLTEEDMDLTHFVVYILNIIEDVLTAE